MISPMIFGREDGFTFNEILAAMSIMVVAVLGYSLSSVGLIQRQTTSSNSTVAIHLAQDKLEELQARPAPLTPMYARPEAIMAFRQDPAPRVFLIDVGVLRYRLWERALSKST